MQRVLLFVILVILCQSTEAFLDKIWPFKVLHKILNPEPSPRPQPPAPSPVQAQTARPIPAPTRPPQTRKPTPRRTPRPTPRPAPAPTPTPNPAPESEDEKALAADLLEVRKVKEKDSSTSAIGTTGKVLIGVFAFAVVFIGAAVLRNHQLRDQEEEEFDPAIAKSSIGGKHHDWYDVSKVSNSGRPWQTNEQYAVESHELSSVQGLTSLTSSGFNIAP